MHLIDPTTVQPQDDLAAAQGRPWEPPPARPKPEGAEYGFVGTPLGEPAPTTREGLIRLCRTLPPPLVWTPETEHMVPPYEVPYLLDALREKLVARARSSVRTAILVALGITAVAVLLAGPLMLVMAMPLLGIWVAYVSGGIARARATSVETLRAGEAGARYVQWERSQPAPRTTALTYMLIAVGAVQVMQVSRSITAAGMDPAQVASGEWWRLLSGALLHGNLVHFLMNFTALGSLGRTMEARAPRAFVPIVFLAAALGGNLLSLFLPPHGLSVGASGGLMGMLGFLLVLGYRRAGHLPDGFRGLMLQNVGLMVLIGLVGYQVIDNAAHAGGLAAGALIGAAAIPRGDRVPEWAGGARLEKAGLSVQWLLWAAAAATMLVLVFRALVGAPPNA